MKRQGWLLIFMGVIVTLIMLSANICAAAEPIKLKFAAYFPPTSKFGQSVVRVLDSVEERSGGRLKFERFWSSSLLTYDKMISGLGQNIVDVAYVCSLFTPAALPLSQATCIYGINYNAWAGLMAWTEFRKFEPIAKEWARNNALPLWPTSFFPSTVISKSKPVRTLEDMKGMRLLTLGGDMPKICRDLGGVPISMAPPDVYDALQKGALDGLFYSVEYIEQWKWEELIKYWMPDTNVGGAIYAMAFNIKTLNKLPKDLQELIIKMGDSGESTDIIWEGAHIKPLKSFVNEEMPRRGIELIRWKQEDKEKLTKVTKSYIDVWAKEAEAKGHTEAKKVMDKWQELYRKYDALYPQKLKKMGWVEPLQ